MNENNKIKFQSTSKPWLWLALATFVFALNSTGQTVLTNSIPVWASTTKSIVKTTDIKSLPSLPVPTAHPLLKRQMRPELPINNPVHLKNISTKVIPAPKKLLKGFEFRKITS